MKRVGRRTWLAVAAMIACASAGCGGDGALRGGAGAVQRGPAPPYAEVAERYNERVERLRSVIAPVVVRFTYRDEDGKQHTDQGEGTLQVVRPDDVALSINKAGKELFWFGCDEQRYWWFDRDKHVASVGRHENFDAAGENGEAPGLAIRPRDLMLVLGIMPLPVPDDDNPGPGATQWSADGRRLGVTTRTAAGGYQRLWLDEATCEPAKVELFGEDRRLVIVADLSEFRYVSIVGFGGVGPRLPGVIVAMHYPSGTLIRLDLSDIQDGAARIHKEAFDFETLVRLFRAQRIVDLDAAVAATPQQRAGGGD